MYTVYSGVYPQYTRLVKLFSKLAFSSRRDLVHEKIDNDRNSIGQKREELGKDYKERGVKGFIGCI